MRPDLRLYLVTDPSFGPDLRRVVVPAVEGGVTCVQVRVKDGAPEQLAEQVALLRAALAGSSALLLSNDVPVPGADGVHGGPKDRHPALVRHDLGDGPVVGWSLAHVDQLDDAAAIAACSYLAVSPVHATPTKADHAPPFGTDGLALVARRVAGRLPLVGIGGMDEHTTAPAIAAGADGVAVVRAVGHAADPRAAARRLRRVVDDALAARDEVRRDDA